MHEGALRALEFDRIVEVVKSFALTPLGASQLAKLRPQTDMRSAQTALAATTECVTYLDSNNPFTLDCPPNIESILTNLAIEGLALDAGQLRGLADFLTSVETMQEAVIQAEAGPFPTLRTMLDGCRSFARETKEIRDKINDSLYVVDDSSMELRSIRDQLQKQTNRLRKTLDSYLRGKDTARYLQEQVITERGGRQVLVVRTEHRGAIPGIIHGSSGSGASLFLEPLSTVEINNNIVALQEDESAEVKRILLILADKLRKRALDLRHTLTAAANIDDLQARATFSRLLSGVEPELTTELHIELLKARHPLLIPEVRKQLCAYDTDSKNPAPAVPVDLRVTAPNSALVITGPNTGGKTVALKTVGLLTIMAQSGLHVPAAAGSRLTVFRSMFADIGDEQSITDSVSTFSGHIKNIVTMNKQLNSPALVLLDEVGAGTDPAEGAALGAAIIEHFRQKGALIVVTTHDEMLKTYAATTDNVTCAGFGFNSETFAPNYELTYGAPGRSLAFEIAARLGVAETIINAARERRSARENDLADHLSKVDQDFHKVRVERQQLESDRKQLDSDRAVLNQKQRDLNSRIEEGRRHFNEGIDESIQSARQEIETVVEELRARAAIMERTAETRAASGKIPLTTGETGKLRTKAHAAIDDVTRQTRGGDTEIRSADPTTSSTSTGITLPLVGSEVSIKSLGLNGRVLTVYNTDAEVEVRGKRLRLPLSDLSTVPNGDSQPTSTHVTVQSPEGFGTLQELNVIGCTADEAISQSEKYLDRAVFHEQRQLRIIHGRGTGVLRRSIAKLLETHPQVARFSPAEAEHGGEGVTVIELKD